MTKATAITGYFGEKGVFARQTVAVLPFGGDTAAHAEQVAWIMVAAVEQGWHALWADETPDGEEAV